MKRKIQMQFLKNVLNSMKNFDHIYLNFKKLGGPIKTNL